MDRTHENPATSMLLGAFVFLFGMEMLRFHVASLGWYQRDTLGVGALDLIPIAVVPFAAGIVLPVISRFLSWRAAMWLGLAALAGARIVTQVTADPGIGHWSSGVGVAAFLGTLALVAGLGRWALVGAVLVGVTLDVAVKASGVSLDLAYRPGFMPLVVVVVVTAAIAYLFTTLEPTEPVGPGWGAGVTVIGLGPLLFVHYLVLQSQGWVAAMTGLASEVAALVIVALNVVGLWLVSRVDRSPAFTAAAALVVGAAAIAAEGPAPVFAVLAVAAVPLAAVLWAALVPDMTSRSTAPSAVYLVVGPLVFLVVGFAYYLPLDMHLGFSQAHVRIAAGVVVAGFGLGAAFRRPAGSPVMPRGMPVVAVVVLLLPAFALFGTPTLGPVEDEPPLTVMSYNIHQAFGTAGDMDPGAVGQVILDSGATVVGVQEIARGGLLNAGTDLLALLGHRLGWEHVTHFGTTDPVWGNAIFSRHPFDETERVFLPAEGTPFRRGYMAVNVDSPIGEVLFVNVHLQHVADSELHATDPEADLLPVHTAQLGRVIETWAGRSPAVLVGDLNARPGWRQVDEFLASGWLDSWEVAGIGAGYTANAADPQYRIDYVFHTPDLNTSGVEIIESQASDHFPVVADLAPAG